MLPTEKLNFPEYLSKITTHKQLVNNEFYIKRVSQELENLKPRNAVLLQSYINALRSGKYNQCRMKLGEINGDTQVNCVAGVYAELTGKTKYIDHNYIYYNDDRYAIYDQFLTYDFADIIMTLNDILMFTFEEIAYVLENYIPVDDQNGN